MMRTAGTNRGARLENTVTPVLNLVTIVVVVGGIFALAFEFI